MPRVFSSPERPVLQELSHADKEEVGRVPRTLEVELTRDLVDSCSAGDFISVLGVVKVLSTTAEPGTTSVVDPCWSCRMLAHEVSNGQLDA